MTKHLFIEKMPGTALLLSLIVSLGLFSCNKDFENTLQNEYGNDSAVLNLGERKVLFIVLDGAVGSEVRTIAPKNLTLISDFSIYSYDALADLEGSVDMPAERGWSNILTGVYPDKHGISGSGFSGNNLQQYPTIFTRLKEKRPDWKTLAFSSSPSFVNELAKDATIKESFNGDDAAVKEAVINKLGSENDASLIVAQFQGIDKAGSQGSYSADDAGYRNAVVKLDEYFGEILDAMRKRPGFAGENWLVVVTSSMGSELPKDAGEASRNAYLDSRRNSLFFAYNPRFKSQNYTKPGTVIPYIGTSPQYNGKTNGSNAKVLNDDNLYDFGETGSYTIQCKVKIKSGGYYYPAILGKRERWSSGYPGWVIFLEADYWMINFGQVGQGNTQVKGQTVSDDKWHTLTVVIRQEGANRMVYTYTDGVYSGNSGNIAGKGNLNTTRPLIAGHFDEDGTSGPDNFFVTDIRIYNEALDAAYIAANFCRVDIPETDPYISNLLGFWKSTSVTGTKELIDYSGHGKNMAVDLLNSVSYSDVSDKVCPDISQEVYRTVPNSVDAINQIYLWYGILISSDWKLDGKSWIPSFSDLTN